MGRLYAASWLHRCQIQCKILLHDLEHETHLDLVLAVSCTLVEGPLEEGVVGVVRLHKADDPIIGVVQDLQLLAQGLHH